MELAGDRIGQHNVSHLALSNRGRYAAEDVLACLNVNLTVTEEDVVYVCVLETDLTVSE